MLYKQARACGMFADVHYLTNYFTITSQDRKGKEINKNTQTNNTIYYLPFPIISVYARNYQQFQFNDMTLPNITTLQMRNANIFVQRK